MRKKIWHAILWFYRLSPAAVLATLFFFLITMLIHLFTGDWTGELKIIRGFFFFSALLLWWLYFFRLDQKEKAEKTARLMKMTPEEREADEKFQEEVQIEIAMNDPLCARGKTSRQFFYFVYILLPALIWFFSDLKK